MLDNSGDGGESSWGDDRSVEVLETVLVDVVDRGVEVEVCDEDGRRKIRRAQRLDGRGRGSFKKKDG